MCGRSGPYKYDIVARTEVKIFMRNSRVKSTDPKATPQPRTYRTFEDWQAEQQRDTRSPEQRGIHVGSAVMWRHRQDRVIATERATVVAIADNILTIQVKDVEMRTCNVDIHEIVNNEDDHRMGMGINRRTTPPPPGEAAPSS